MQREGFLHGEGALGTEASSFVLQTTYDGTTSMVKAPPECLSLDLMYPSVVGGDNQRPAYSSEESTYTMSHILGQLCHGACALLGEPGASALPPQKKLEAEPGQRRLRRTMHYTAADGRPATKCVLPACCRLEARSPLLTLHRGVIAELLCVPCTMLAGR